MTEASATRAGSEAHEIKRERIRHWTLWLGVLQVTVGCLFGLLPPSMVEWFRGVVMAHLGFTANGVLMIVLGLLVREMQLGPKLLGLWFWSLQVGTWLNGAAGVIAAFTGAASKFTPAANHQAPPPGGDASRLVAGSLALCAVAILLALVLTLYGLASARRNRPPVKPGRFQS